MGLNTKEDCNSIDKNLKKHIFGSIDLNKHKSLTILRPISNDKASNEVWVNLDVVSECFLKLRVCTCCNVMQLGFLFYYGSLLVAMESLIFCLVSTGMLQLA